jgi:DNA-damage-inducible protein D
VPVAVCLLPDCHEWDVKNRRIAAAQAYFVTVAEAFRQYVQEGDGVKRVLVRSEVSERETALSSTVATRGVQQYAFFQMPVIVACII